jgi:hypothetical protein
MTLPEKHNCDDNSTRKSDGEVEMVTPAGGSEYEKKLVRKLDKHIVPVVIMLYLLSFLDRLAIFPYMWCWWLGVDQVCGLQSQHRFCEVVSYGK